MISAVSWHICIEEFCTGFAHCIYYLDIKKPPF